MTSHFFNMLMCYEKNLTLNLIAFFNKLLYKHYNLHLWHIDVETQRKNNEVFYQFQFRELFVFIFRAMMKYRCFHRFFIMQKKT